VVVGGIEPVVKEVIFIIKRAGGKNGFGELGKIVVGEGVGITLRNAVV